MKDLNFETGLVTYNLNGAFQLTFNPTDSEYIERIYNTFSVLDEKKDEYEEEIKQAAQNEIFAICRRRDAEMRELIDEALGAPVCEAVFGNMNINALADGLPVWANLLLAVMDEMDNSFAREQKRTNPRVAKYTAKYSKK